MASIKNLKKDVEFLASDIISTLCIKNSITEDKADKTAELIVKAAMFKNDYRKRSVNCTADKKDKKAVKAYYHQLRQDLFDDFKKLVDEVNAY